MFQKLKNNWLIIGIVFVVIILIAITGITINALVNNATINIQVAPASATITMNGHSVSSGKIKVKPGAYTISASKDGFESQTTSIEIKENQTIDVLLGLEPNSEETKNWYQEHDSDRLLFEGIAGNIFDNETSTMLQKYPIIEFLPYSGTTFDINYGPCEEKEFCIMINAVIPAGFDDAVNYIREHTSEPGKYYYQYTDFSNPFINLSVSPLTNDAKELSTTDDSAIKQKIQDLFKDYKISLKTLKLQDYYAIASIEYDLENEDFPGTITYRFILQKANSGIILITTPEILLSYQNYPDIPHSVIDALNSL